MGPKVSDKTTKPLSVRSLISLAARLLHAICFQCHFKGLICRRNSTFERVFTIQYNTIILEASTQAQDQMKSRFFLNIVIGKRSAIFELLTRKDETLLIRRNAFLVLNLGFHILDRVGRLDIERNGFAREGLDKNLNHLCFLVDSFSHLDRSHK